MGMQLCLSEATRFLKQEQAWIEASTKGAVLLFTASEIESATAGVVSPAVAGLLGGMGGGIAQAYATMGEHMIPIPTHVMYPSKLVNQLARAMLLYQD
jgi:hypothetical protein